MDPKNERGEGGVAATGDESVGVVATAIRDVEPGSVGMIARQLDAGRTTRERIELPSRTLRRLAILVVYVVSLLLISFSEYRSGLGSALFPPSIVLAALVFELLDSAAGMGFGTTLAPLLFILGYDPLHVTPVLLITETLTGVVSGGVHHEVGNVSFSLRPPNDATKLMALFGGAGAVGSIVLTYFLFSLPEAYIETYVTLLVLLRASSDWYGPHSK